MSAITNGNGVTWQWGQWQWGHSGNQVRSRILNGNGVRSRNGNGVWQWGQVSNLESTLRTG